MRVISTARVRALATAVWCLAAAAMGSQARANDFIYPGVQPKVEGGAGDTISRGSVALFYNPANLIFTKFVEPDLDVSYAQVTYTYQQTNTDKYNPVVVKVNAPPVTAGLGFRPVPNLAFGVSILPLGTGAPQAIPQVPLELSPGAYQLMDITQKETAYNIAGGAAFRLADEFTVGMALIHGTEQTQLQVVNDETGDAFIDARYQTTWNQFALGVRSELFDRTIALGLSYKTAVVKKYQGDILINVDPATSNYQAYTGVGYIPAEIGFGAEARFGAFGLFGDLTHSSWSAGRTIATRATDVDPKKTYIQDYIDENDIAAGVKFWPSPKHMLTVAFASIGTNQGNGSEEQTASGSLKLDNAGATVIADGMQFGDLAAIQRQVFSGGYRYKLSGTGFFELGGSYQKGSRIVPEGYPQSGSYTLSILMVSAGVAFGF